jgi:hypothetical protein
MILGEKVVISNQSEYPSMVFLPTGGTNLFTALSINSFEESPVLTVNLDHEGTDNLIYLSSKVIGIKGVRVIQPLGSRIITAVLDLNTNEKKHLIKYENYENIHIIISPEGILTVNDGSEIVKALSSAQKA